MPVNKLNLEDERYSFLKPIFNDKKYYIDFFDRKLSSKGKHNWSQIPLYAAHVKYVGEGKKFNRFREYINSLPEHIIPVVFNYSLIKGKTAFHEEHWTSTKGFHRIHIPLKNVEKYTLFVKEDNGIVEYNYTTDHIYEFENPYYSHMPVSDENNDRLFIIFDYYNLKENTEITEKDVIKDVLIEAKAFAKEGGQVYY